MLKRYLFIIITAILICLLFTNNFFKVNYIDSALQLYHNYTDISNGIREENKPEVSPAPTPLPDSTPQPSSTPPFKNDPLKITSTGISKKNYSKLQKNIKEYLDSQQGVYGVYFLDLKSGQTFNINSTRKFIAASTIKVPINLYLYQMYSEGKISLDETITYEECDYEEGTGDIQYAEFGTEYTLKELSRLSIEASDNVAINMLARYLGYEKIIEYRESLVNHTIQQDRNVTTPKDMAIYLKVLLDLTQNSPDTHELLDFLLNTEYNDRIPLYLPEDVPVAHKIGNQVEACHDVGIVFAKRPYILCLYSEKVDEETAPETLAQVSKMIYDFSQN